MQTLSDFGTFGAGDLVISSNTTDAPVDSAATATINTNHIAATNASFAINKLIAIYQMRKTGVGNWEYNFISSYTAGDITTQFNNVNAYVAESQVIQIEQYNKITVNSGVTWTAKSWNGATGGIISTCAGSFLNQGTIELQGKGFRGAPGVTTANTYAISAEGSAGDAPASYFDWYLSNGNGGGGGQPSLGTRSNAGGGGGNAAAGSVGEASGVGLLPGQGGLAAGNTALTSMVLGGGGGAGASGTPSATFTTAKGAGGNGGGIFHGYHQRFENQGTIRLNGNNGTDSARDGAAGGAGGAGGSFKENCVEFINSGSILNVGGVGGIEGGFPQFLRGGTGSNGRNRIETCVYTNSGTISGTTSVVEGGFDYCQSFVHIY